MKKPSKEILPAAESSLDLKGQITIEFLVVVIALLFIFSFALAVYASNSLFFSGFEERSEARQLALSIGNALNSAFAAGNGSSEVFFFPAKNDLNAFLHENILTLRSKNSIADFALASSSISFENFSFNSRLKFSNINGVVFVEKIS